MNTDLYVNTRPSTTTGTGLLSSHGRQTQPVRSEAELILARLPLTVEIIEKEYSEYNLKHATRKQKRIIPHLFYSFYTSDICIEFILACSHYLNTFLKDPIKEGEELNLSGPESHRHAPSKKILTLQECLHRVAEAWGRILMYRADMNRFETITISKTMKKSQHFLNDTYDNQFYETLYLLVEYVLEFRFTDAARTQQLAEAAANRSTNSTTASNSVVSSPTNAASSSPLVSPTEVATKAATKASMASAAAMVASTESNWRMAQHELQRLLRSRNFNYSQKQRSATRPPNLPARGNGLNHAPLGGNPNTTTQTSNHHRKHGTHGKGSTSYRNPATFSLFGIRHWNDPPPDIDDIDDTRAISHLPGQFHTRGQTGILECLDLRSPLIASVLANPRTMALANDRYVFGNEERRANAKRKYHGRLTHAEEKYIIEQHERQELKEKMRLEREQREEKEQQEQEAELRRKQQEERIRITHVNGNEIGSLTADELEPPASSSTKQEESKENGASSLSGTNSSFKHLTIGLTTSSQDHSSSSSRLQPPSSSSIPALRFPVPTPPTAPMTSGSSTLRPRPPSGNGTGGRRMHHLSGSQTTRSGKLEPLDWTNQTTAATQAQTARRLTLDEKLSDSTAPLIRRDGNRIMLLDL